MAEGSGSDFSGEKFFRYYGVPLKVQQRNRRPDIVMLPYFSNKFTGVALLAE